MIIFWILAGGLVGLALLFIVVPLSRATPPEAAPEQDMLNLEVFKQRLRELDVDLEAGLLEQEQYAAARRDLERELLYDLDGGESAKATARSSSTFGRWALGAGLAVAVPVSVVLVYLELGTPGIIDQLQTPALAQSEGAGGQQGDPLDVLIQRLEERLRESPENLEGWLMLGRTYFATNQPEAGLKAIERAYALAPDQAEVKLAYAEGLATVSPGKSLEGRPAELIQSALEQEPDNLNARWLSGLLAFQRAQYNAAVVAWKKILDETDPASEEAGNLKKMIEEAQGRAGLPASENIAASAPMEPVQPVPSDPATSEATEATATPDQPPADGQVGVTLDVSLAASLAGEASPEDTVFVFARAAQGPPMPLAVQRLRVKDLPSTVTLDDSMAMTPAMRLSAFDQVLVGARISKSGDATPRAGDLEGQAGPLDPQGQRGVAVIIDRVRP
ncbi:c-type cytochrome biogenesis protein CcmI [Thiocystis violacea]|uniref:c-type cytochrome biogenesis protein CcmI n=1 Tax=Thiocystis violacea TaxID=13725 RepID=UPI0019038926|nr:c-type cytochrome biogenesis protein CcmI [Thiocystis violacea]MBK1719339.1 c-type cytochrome biogenesis protein CcmI [Thiocystis violacea]